MPLHTLRPCQTLRPNQIPYFGGEDVVGEGGAGEDAVGGGVAVMDKKKIMKQKKLRQKKSLGLSVTLKSVLPPKVTSVSYHMLNKKCLHMSAFRLETLISYFIVI
ncbi:hypothetical protein SK128_015237 [Halocaridina rubra]|uniref:Uncharacterized protein n=1 Tax=Halocaridina rubra TaxID=373956 RepID=A0AAN8WLH4_HALRR